MAAHEMISVHAEPYKWPIIGGGLVPQETALLVIDMQNDFCGRGGYVDKMGYDISLARKPIEPIKSVLDAIRRIPGFTVIHTREGHRPDLSDCPLNKLLRSKRINAGIGDPGPFGRLLVRGEPGWDIVDELKPLQNEIIVDKPGKGAFYSTDLDMILRRRGVTMLLITGVTTDVCVHTTMREANDRGYECLLLGDCCAALDEGNHQAALKMVKMSGGIFGAVSDSTSLLSALCLLEGSNKN